MSTKRLIDMHLSGKGARHLIDAVLEELPPLPAIRTSLLRDLPKGSRVRVDEADSVFYVDCADRYVLKERLAFYERAYPEIDFVVIDDE
jgi:hypothetical protein